MSFIESYKHLDKICGEMFETQYGVSAYIEEMLNNPRGSFLVRGWENDLKQLKHYRWIRNQIVHEPDCYEETMCEAGDDEWLDDFYERIINQTDPLAMYFQATKPHPVAKSAQNHKPESPTYTYSQQTTNHEESFPKVAGCMTFLVGILIIVVAIVLILKIL